MDATILALVLLVERMASVSALRKTSVIMGALIGTPLLHEPLGVRRVVVASLVVLGVALQEAGPAG